MTETTWSQDLYTQAYRYAAYAHQGQTVPGTELPYIMHLSLVGMELIAAFNIEKGHDEDFAIQCALLHDVIEDTDITYHQIKQDFGSAIADGVLALSKDTTIPEHLQIADSLRRIKQQPREVWMVKLADRIANLQPPPAHWTQAKIVRYREQAIEIHRMLGDASPLLSTRLSHKIREYKTYINP